jgi:hypothetical protein
MSLLDDDTGKDPMIAYENEIIKGLHSAKRSSQVPDPQPTSTEGFFYPNSWQMEAATRHLTHRIQALRHEHTRLRAESHLRESSSDNVNSADVYGQDETQKSVPCSNPEDFE